MKRKKYLFSKAFLLLAALPVFFLGSCSNTQSRSRESEEWVKGDGRIKVLSTTGMISDIVKMVGRDKVDVFSLISEELDPHTYQLVKGDSEKFEFAGVIFYNGLELEHGPSLKNALENSSKSYSIGGWIQKSDPAKILYVNGQVDPHIWMDVSLWIKGIPFVAKTLSDIDPENKEFYEKNGKEVYLQLKKLDTEVFSLLQAIPEQKRYLVTSHDAFQYFTRRYLATDEEKKEKSWQHRFQAPEGLAPDSQVSPIDIYHIVDHLQKHQIQVIFPEANVNPSSLRKIQESAKSKGLFVQISACPLFSDSLGKRGGIGDTYRKMIWHNASEIAAYLSGKKTSEEKCK